MEEEDENYSVGIVAMQGWRSEMVRALRAALHALATVLCVQQNTMWRCSMMPSGEVQHPLPC